MGRPKKDLTGQKFNMLTALEFDYISEGGATFWKFKCDCGAIKPIEGSKVSGGKTKSCGCLRAKLLDITGNKYGKLSVESFKGYKYLGTKKLGVWVCRCDCGNIIERAWSHNLKRSLNSNCGCLKIKEATPVNKLLYTYTKAASECGREFSLDREEFTSLIAQNCHYCGEPPNTAFISKSKINHSFKYNGIDRVDNSVGYIKTNVVPCCRRCNFCKGMIGYSEFLQWIKKAHDHLFINKNNVRVCEL